MEENKIQLTTPEIAALWTSYIQSSATICFYKHFLQSIQDSEIKPIVEEALILEQTCLKKVEKIFAEERFPVPKGFSEKDVDLSAPPLYTDLFALSFVYRVGQVAVPYYASVLTKVGRTDIVEFFDECLQNTTKLYKSALKLMLCKGIYDRPPKIPYPKEVVITQKQETLLSTWFGDRRPLNASELGEIFYTIERNYIGVILLIGLIQVMKDKEIKEYLMKGKKLAEKQINILNTILRKEDHLGNIPVSMEVTASTDSPFSDRLILFLITTTTSTGIYLMAFTMSTSMRKDLIAHYSTLILEVMKYSEEGLEMMINRGWLEQLPQAPDRDKLADT